MFFGIFFTLSALVSAEVGLVVRCTNPALNNQEVRLMDGQLSIGHGPTFQGYFDTNENFLISSRLIAHNFTGAGLGVSKDQQLIVAAQTRPGFYARGGWLEYNDSPVFYFERTENGDWLCFITPGEDVTRSVPAMLQIADIDYPGADKIEGDGFEDVSLDAEKPAEKALPPLGNPLEVGGSFRGFGGQDDSNYGSYPNLYSGAGIDPGSAGLPYTAASAIHSTTVPSSTLKATPATSTTTKVPHTSITRTITHTLWAPTPTTTQTIYLPAHAVGHVHY